MRFNQRSAIPQIVHKEPVQNIFSCKCTQVKSLSHEMVHGAAPKYPAKISPNLRCCKIVLDFFSYTYANSGTFPFLIDAPAVKAPFPWSRGPIWVNWQRIRYGLMTAFQWVGRVYPVPIWGLLHFHIFAAWRHTGTYMRERESIKMELGIFLLSPAEFEIQKVANWIAVSEGGDEHVPSYIVFCSSDTCVF